ncbi:MAG: TatD family hydrolase [Saprospiraceae bacterium]|nr:TatD family hydrolase [Saprospiraceae bacterium]
MSTAPFIDFHTHKRRFSNPEVIEIVSVHPGKHHTDSWFTIGYHPWWTEEALNSAQTDVIKNSFSEHKFCLGVGECGLDKLKGPDLGVQEEILRSHILMANESEVPVIIHCVRAFQRLLQIRKEMGKTDWAVHGFVRNKVLAGQLLDAGFYLSVAPHDKMSDNFTEMIKYIPADRLFLETDSHPDMNILENYKKASLLRKCEVEDLKSQIFENLKVFFKWKKVPPNGWSALNC